MWTVGTGLSGTQSYVPIFTWIYTNSQTICDFLDSARNPNTHNTTSHRPAPTLAPATIEGEIISREYQLAC